MTTLRPSRPRSRVLVAAPMVVAVVALSAATTACASDGAAAEPDASALGPGEVTIELDVEHSVFDPEEIRVLQGTEVTFEVVNGDPIGHELIVGDAALHAAHEAGTHVSHAPIPGEVSLQPNASGATTIRFDEPGTVEFACHLPGHYDYGMYGEIVVVPAE